MMYGPMYLNRFASYEIRLLIFGGSERRATGMYIPIIFRRELAMTNGTSRYGFFFILKWIYTDPRFSRDY